MAAVERGQPAPELHVLVPGGAEKSLGDYRGRPLLLIFLRHLA